jgi:hypothetical protein
MTPDDKLDPNDLTSDGTVVQADPVHAETLLAAILAATEEIFNDQPAVWAARYEERLRASIQHDKAARGSVSMELSDRVDQRALSLLFHTPQYFS